MGPRDGCLLLHHLNYKHTYIDYTKSDNGLSKADVSGCFRGGNGKLLDASVVYILTITAWTLGHMVPCLFLIRLARILCVDKGAEERMSLDSFKHNQSQHNLSQHNCSVYEAILPADAGTGRDQKRITDEALLSQCAALHNPTVHANSHAASTRSPALIKCCSFLG